ncbi:hypothetical protein Br6_04994 [Rhodococcus sp. Br-6]|nr:hypothetical protein Br6_04994 [Rhodococcus sp. Br-6]
MPENAIPTTGTDRSERKWRTVDRLATATLGLLAVSAGVCAVGLSLLFVMATDSCPADCDTSPVDQGIAVTWIGTAAIIAVMITGIVWSIRNDRTAFVWPLLASPAIVGMLLLGASIANTAIGQ